jgi:3-hydroxyisobutyrate dehydrogenase-like beta-hydroxyacid dehydrogenase
MAKDVGYALQEAHERKLDLKTASAALDVLKQAIANGFGEKDFTAVVQALQPGKE